MKQLIVILFGAAALLPGQAPDMKSATGYLRAVQAQLKNNVVKAAEKMPEESYGFRPSHDVRTFGQLIGHVANAEFNFCAAVLGEKNPNTVNVEKEKTSKADLVAAITESFNYCQKAYLYLSDDKIAETAKMGNNERSKFGLLAFNNAHTNEHYGNIVTYMRIRGLVPPSSEPK
jgi:uncharacterized damage-inducible protein DinB